VFTPASVPHATSPPQRWHTSRSTRNTCRSSSAQRRRRARRAQRTDDEGVGDLRLGPSTRRLFDAQANDIFLVKATYYLNL